MIGPAARGDLPQLAARLTRPPAEGNERARIADEGIGFAVPVAGGIGGGAEQGAGEVFSNRHGPGPATGEGDVVPRVRRVSDVVDLDRPHLVSVGPDGDHAGPEPFNESQSAAVVAVGVLSDELRRHVNQGQAARIADVRAEEVVTDTERPVLHLLHDGAPQGLIEQAHIGGDERGGAGVGVADLGAVLVVPRRRELRAQGAEGVHANVYRAPRPGSVGADRALQPLCKQRLPLVGQDKAHVLLQLGAGGVGLGPCGAEDLAQGVVHRGSYHARDRGSTIEEGDAAHPLVRGLHELLDGVPLGVQDVFERVGALAFVALVCLAGSGA